MKKNPSTLPVESYDLANSQDGLDLANELKKFIQDNRLSSQVQGKDFVNVEAWQYAGYRLGIVPVVAAVRNVSTEHELKYEATVTLLDLRREVTVGGGTAICSNKESGKKFYQEFAIAGMAQTRATGRAFRNVLAWLIRAAGYEPTPAEEMEYAGNVSAPNPAPALAPVPTPKDYDSAGSVPLAVTAESAGPAPSYATAAQKEQIIRLLNHPLITRQEKTKMLLNINRLDEERAAQAIGKLLKTIEDREGVSSVAA